MNLRCFYIQFLVSAPVSDWFFYSIIYHETSKLVDSRQTGFQWRISLGLIYLDNLAKTISYQLFKTCSSKDNILHIYLQQLFFIRLPNSCITNFCTYFHVWTLKQLNGTYLHPVSYSCFEATQLLRNYHVPIYLSEILGLYHRQRMWCHQQNYIPPNKKY